MQLTLALLGCAACAVAAPVRAQSLGEPPPSAEPGEPAWAAPEPPDEFHAGDGRAPRIVATLGVGLPVRMRRDRRLGQGRLAPAYADVFAGYLFEGATLQHGLGLTLSLGVSEDGGFLEPTEALSQALIAPTYVLGLDLHPALTSLVHAAVPVALSGGTTAGLDVGFTAAYRLLAGTGVYAQLSAVTFVGLARRLYPVVALELGIMVDYEVLP